MGFSVLEDDRRLSASFDLNLSRLLQASRVPPPGKLMRAIFLCLENHHKLQVLRFFSLLVFIKDLFILFFKFNDEKLTYLSKKYGTQKYGSSCPQINM